MLITLLVIGAIATILNFLLNIIATITAVRRTKYQADLYKWKREKYDADHRGEL